MNNTIESKPKWNNGILLFTSQALFQTASILVMTLSGMAVLELATDRSLATLPIAMISVGTAAMMIPAEKAQAFNDFFVFVAISVSSFSAGALLLVLAGSKFGSSSFDCFCFDKNNAIQAY